MKLLAFAALAASAIALPAAAAGLGPLTDPQTYLRGGYIELEGGSTVQGATTEYNDIAGVGSNEGSGHFRPGYFGGAILGHRIAPGIGVELEGVWMKNRYNSETEAFQQTAGHTQTYGGLANLRFSLPYDYHITQRFAVVPYVAAGAGYGETDYHTGFGGTTFLDNGRSGLLWQGKAGLEVKTGTPISLDFGYRYMGTPDYNQGANLQNGGDSFLLRSHVQAATAGIKYTF